MERYRLSFLVSTQSKSALVDRSKKCMVADVATLKRPVALESPRLAAHLKNSHASLGHWSSDATLVTETRSQFPARLLTRQADKGNN